MPRGAPAALAGLAPRPRDAGRERGDRARRLRRGALPGGDPLQAALAAGEIPSLEMVAAAGEKGGVRPLVGLACIAAVLTALAVYATVNVRSKLPAWDPMEKAPAVLADKAREMITA
ncbi:MAG: hypothetical protein ACE5EV_00925, partial [Gaiellales bacterium]